jgi:putative nucleotidyltransferase with HDIG domain
MSASARPEMIDVQALRVGMVVHLDGGWMSHPFALSRFKIASDEQISTIRALGLKRVRWEPMHSDPAPAAAAGAETAAEPADRLGEPPGDTPGSAPAVLPEEASRMAHRRALARQRETLNLCERQFAEAAEACNELTRQVPIQPRKACGQAESLSRALVDKMLGAPEPCIHLLTGAAGHKAAAHALNVTVVSLLLGRRLGLDEAQLQDIGVGALLHDIGKLELHEAVRHHDEHFIASELRAYEEHVANGVVHARKMGMSPGAMLVVAQHHEHADGSGFPLRLGNEKMSVPARIVALVNRYDNLCNPRLVAKAMTPHEALAMLFAASAGKFDSDVLGAFIKMMGVYPPGSTVQLSDDRYALVMAVNSSRPLKPRVLVHDDAVPREEALLIDLEREGDLGIRRSVKALHMPPSALHYLAPARRVVYFFEPARELVDAS